MDGQESRLAESSFAYDYTDEDAPLIHSPMIWRLPRSLSYMGERKKHADMTDARRTLGTFGGVFCSIALAQFSTFLFLRVGFMVGQSGILEAILQVVLGYTILLMTILSICAISTNGAVEGGGAYYMISRAMGPEFGGSLGFIFYVANVLSCALYITGFVEGLVENFGTGGIYIADGAEGLPVEGRWWKYLYSSMVLFICLIICLVGGSMFAKTVAIILAIVAVCTLSVVISVLATNHTIQVGIPKDNDYGQNNHLNLTNQTVKFNYTGLSAQTFKDNLYSNFTLDYSTETIMNFASVFAILFSGVTGIMNGANMSGELKDPSKSIPKGTLSAVAFTFTTYIVMTILIGGSCQRSLLVNNYIFLQQINLWSPFVIIGIFAATMSAALGNLIGASRVLEALANDQLFWSILNPAMVTTKGGNPYVAVLISWILVELVFLIGSLNAIAPATSVFFLMSYASTNLACMALDLAAAPNFRPTFKYFSWHTSLLGLIGSLVMCFLISAIYTSVAIIIMLLFAIILHFRSVPTSWGSISQALIFHQVRKYLLMLDSRKAHVKYWRPQILLMVAKPKQNIELIDFINDLKKGGLYVLGHVKLGLLADYPEKDPLLDEYPKWMKLVDKLNIKAFVELTLARSVSEGLQHLVRSAGLGGMKTNTVCIGFYDDNKPVDSFAKKHIAKRSFFGSVENSGKVDIGEHFGGIRDKLKSRDLNQNEFVQLIEDSLKMEKNVLLCRYFNDLNKAAILSSKGITYIDVWPVNFFRPQTVSFFDTTCLFLLQLACILNMKPGWKSKTCLRVFLFATAEETEPKKQQLEKYLRQLRIMAKIQIVSWESIPQNESVHKFDLSVDYSNSRMQEYNKVSSEYLAATNRLVDSYSNRTCVTFLYLPRPPRDVMEHVQYLDQLQILTERLPPTVLVHGLHSVTSTTL